MLGFFTFVTRRKILRTGMELFKLYVECIGAYFSEIHFKQFLHKKLWLLYNFDFHHSSRKLSKPLKNPAHLGNNFWVTCIVLEPSEERLLNDATLRPKIGASIATNFRPLFSSVTFQRKVFSGETLMNWKIGALACFKIDGDFGGFFCGNWSWLIDLMVLRGVS